MEGSRKRKIEKAQPEKLAAYNVEHFNLTNYPVCDISVLEESYEQIEPQIKGSEVVDIIIPASSHHWLALHECFLYLNLCVQTKDGAPVGSNTKTAYANYILASIWESIDIKINNVSITSGGNLSGYSAMINKILYNSMDKLTRRGPLEGFYVSSSGEDTGSNEVYTKLLAQSKKTNMEVYGKIPHGLFDTPRYLPPGYSVSIRLRLAPNSFALNCPALAAGATFSDRIFLKNIYLDTKRCIANSKIDLAYEHQIKNKKLLYVPFVDYQCQSFVIPSGQLTFTSEILLNTLPSFAAFAIVPSKAFYGDHEKNAFLFKSHNLSGFRFSQNNEDLLFKNARLSVSNNEYVRYYNQLLSMRDQNNDLGCDASLTEFAERGFCVIPVWNSLNGKRNRTPVSVPGPIRLSLSFKEATSENLSILFYYELPKRIELDGNTIFVKNSFTEDNNIE